MRSGSDQERSQTQVKVISDQLTSKSHQGQVRSGRVRSSQVRSGQVRSGQFM